MTINGRYNEILKKLKEKREDIAKERYDGKITLREYWDSRMSLEDRIQAVTDKRDEVVKKIITLLPKTKGEVTHSKEEKKEIRSKERVPNDEIAEEAEPEETVVAVNDDSIGEVTVSENADEAEIVDGKSNEIDAIIDDPEEDKIEGATEEDTEVASSEENEEEDFPVDETEPEEAITEEEEVEENITSGEDQVQATDVDTGESQTEESEHDHREVDA